MGAYYSSIATSIDPRATTAQARNSPGSSTTAAAVPGGPRWYRTRLRTRGPIVALAPPIIVALLSIAVTRLFDSRLSGLAGLFGTLVAAPALLFVGAPFTGASSYLVAAVASAVIWAAIGWGAARRSTRNPTAQWSEFWREYAWMAGGIAAGVVVALIAASVIIGDSLL
jgi:hypothetical protein